MAGVCGSRWGGWEGYSPGRWAWDQPGSQRRPQGEDGDTHWAGGGAVWGRAGPGRPGHPQHPEPGRPSSPESVTRAEAHRGGPGVKGARECLALCVWLGHTSPQPWQQTRPQAPLPASGSTLHDFLSGPPSALRTPSLSLLLWLIGDNLLGMSCVASK